MRKEIASSTQLSSGYQKDSAAVTSWESFADQADKLDLTIDGDGSVLSSEFTHISQPHLFDGQHISAIFTPDLHQDFHEALHQVLEFGISQEIEIKSVVPPKPQARFSSRFQAICEQNKINGVSINLTRIVDDMDSQQESKNVKTPFETSQRLESLGLLSSEIAHDLNGLLTSILGHVELAQTNLTQSAKSHENLEAIRRATLLAADLVKQILSIISKKGESFATHDLNQIISDMMPLLNLAIRADVDINLDLNGNSPYFEGNQAQIKQLVLNLVTNAAEAIGSKNGEISISTGIEHFDSDKIHDTVEGELVVHGTYLYLRVQDTGSGLPKELRSKIFTPLYSTKTTGHGLGLAAVLSIVRNHNGVIQLQSSTGQGTTFKILIPQAEKMPESSSSLEDKTLQWRGSGTVLLVDDMQATLEITKRLLEHIGFKVRTAADGIRALEIFEENKTEITFAMLDANMPRISGWQTLEKLRKLDANIPVLLMSGSRLGGEKQADAGFIQKPFQLIELIQAIQKILPQP